MGPTEGEWFVGINDEPIGPNTVAFLIDKVAAGVVNRDSLVWKDGMGDWQPLHTVEELSFLVPAPVVKAQPAPAIQPAAAPAAEPSPAIPAAAASRPVALTRVKEPTADQEPAVAAEKPPAEKPAAPAAISSEAAPTPSAEQPPEPSVPSEPVKPSEPEPPEAPVAVDKRPVSGPEQVDKRSRHRRDRRRRRRGMKPIAYAFIAMAAGFGAVLAYVLFAPQTPTPSELALNTATGALGTNQARPTTPTAKPVETTTAVELDAVPVTPGGTRTGGRAPSSSTVTSGPTAKPKKTGTAGGIDTSMFDTPGVTGPTTSPGSTDDTMAKSQLSQGEIQGVVNRGRSGIRHACWQPALASHTGGPKTAKVMVAVTVGRSGRVLGASASGGGGFPGLASCIQGRVAGWRFPRSGGTTTVNVPFVFAAQ